MADAILLEGLRFVGYHGISPEERALGRHFIVDVTVELDLRDAGAHDALDETVDYASIYTVVRTVVEGDASMLIEAVADRSARAILEAFAAVTAAEVTVREPSVTFRGAHLDAVGVRIRRVRAHVDATQAVAVPKPPFLTRG